MNQLMQIHMQISALVEGRKKTPRKKLHHVLECVIHLKCFCVIERAKFMLIYSVLLTR